jgi:cellulose synthase/poly-beta-1,6-N-acetylglucosamine synthase-like glycosyltransferase/spore germination protein YaaH/peptidoglycan/xylan/chitin deacetylase (PgdA/CDA1 family)
MSTNPSQIFQTNTKSRWQRFRWLGRLLLFFIILSAVLFRLYLFVSDKTHEEMNLPLEDRAIKKVLVDSIPSYRESNLGKQYRGMRKYIQNRWATGKGCGQKNNIVDLSNSDYFSDSLGIRAAFYVAWDPQSFFSLRKNISKLNLVLPEWFFIDPTADTIITKIDTRAFDLIKKSGIEVMPILSNAIWNTGKFNGAALHRIFNNKQKSEHFINQILDLLTQYDFTGINVDFEDLKEKKNEVLSNFQKKLYDRLHAEGFLVTQNVSPFNDDYNYEELAKYNDYLFLMAYDEHSDDTGPGPIGSQKWVESCVDKLAQKVPASKIVLNLAAFGYDWNLKNKYNKTITYQQALTKARDTNAKLDFDNDTYNLNYRYYDDKDAIHEVHFTDAATNFNSLRFATEYNLAGTAVWRLGSEDPRLWDFYNKPMTKAALKTFDFNDFNSIDPISDVDYIGENGDVSGEILELMATPSEGHITSEIDTSAMLISEELFDKLPSSYVIKKWGHTSEKKLILTYDDGPDPVYTKEILDTLAYYHVPASFFVVGIQAENNIPLVKRIYREGHEIGNHTFTHPNIAEVSKNRALLEMDLTEVLIECITGHSTILFRAPFNADSDPEAKEELVPIALSKSRNYITVGEGIDPTDWEKADHPELNSDTILNRVIRIYNDHVDNGDSLSIILLHDAGGDRSETVKATGKIIRYYRNKGYKFTTIADLLHKKRDDLMPAVPRGSGYALFQFNTFLWEAGYWLGETFYTLFLLFLILSCIRLLILGFFAVSQKIKENKNKYIFIDADNVPLASIIVPAFNEEVNAISSLENLLLCDYQNFEIVFVDDGSADNTYEKVKNAFNNHSKVKVFTKSNGGKASALNFGIAQSQADFVVCIDADTKLLPNAVSYLMRNFKNEKVGAVAGIVKVGNEVNILTRWQSIEYTTSQNFDRKGFAYINCITVVPGAIGAFRKEALLSAGGFTTDTLAEDCDITVRILKEGYIVANEPKAIALTEAPESIKQFMKQRFRWTFGVMQTFWKQREVLFNTKYKSLGWIAFPDILLFKYIIPFFSPLGDVLMIFGLLTESRSKILTYYLIFLMVDAMVSILAFAMEKQKAWKLIWLLPQRLIYRWMMLIILFRALGRAIKGELQHWGVLKRTGNVKDITTASS